MTNNPTPDALPGIHKGLCNRKACRAPGADHWNVSTRAWYCGKCADFINEGKYPHVVLAPYELPPAPPADGLRERIKRVVYSQTWTRNGYVMLMSASDEREAFIDKLVTALRTPAPAPEKPGAENTGGAQETAPGRMVAAEGGREISIKNLRQALAAHESRGDVPAEARDAKVRDAIWKHADRAERFKPETKVIETRWIEQALTPTKEQADG